MSQVPFMLLHDIHPPHKREVVVSLDKIHAFAANLSYAGQPPATRSSGVPLPGTEIIIGYNYQGTPMTLYVHETVEQIVTLIDNLNARCRS